VVFFVLLLWRSCRTALTDGKYRWRHDKILSVIAASLDAARKKKLPVQTKPKLINFVKEGGSVTSSRRSTGLLTTARDWDILVDLKKQLKFPAEIANTKLRPDILLLSRMKIHIVLLELTVPWEERMEEAHKRKKAKSQALMDECRQQGWQTWNLPVEVGSRGFAGQSLWRAFSIVGITGLARRQAITDICQQAEAVSPWLWQKRAAVDS